MFEKLYRDMHAVPREGDYQGVDDLLYCGKCQTQRECYIMLQDGRKICKPIPCQCEREEERKYQERRDRKAFQDRVNELRKQGVTDEAYTRQTFLTDDNRNPQVTDKCSRYVDRWDEMKQKCYGMVLFGGVGGGKSFYACCIANALIDKGVKVLVTRLSDLVRYRIQQTPNPINLGDFELIVLDDIGVESATQTAYSIVDDIYRARIPLIVTTNLSLAHLKDKQQEIARQRIYDRIIERAVIDVFVDVRRSRLDIAREKSRHAHEVLNR